jgi:hypothetical protein
VRHRYPYLERRTADTDLRGTTPPTEPTDAEPGTEEKIRVFQERIRKRQGLFHPRDARKRGED